MELQLIKPNTLVEHSELGVGQIIETEGPKVRLRFNPDHEKVVSMSEAHGEAYRALPENGLEACYIKDPDEVRSWVYDGQLRLIAAAMADAGGEGRVGELQKRLEERFIKPKNISWKTWWEKTRKEAVASPHFEFPQQSNKPILLTAKVEDIPVESVFPALKTATRPTSKTSRRQASPDRSLAVELTRLRKDYEAELKQQRENHAADLAAQRKAFDQAGEQLAADLEQQRENHKKDMVQQRESYAKDIDQQRESHSKDLKRRDDEEERLSRQIRTLRAELTKEKQESHLEIRKDMLLRIGDILQRAYLSDDAPEVKLSQVRELLLMALKDGGTEPLGKVGEIVSYDTRIHHSWETVASGSMVRVNAPGVVARGGSFGELVILKANVTQHLEVRS
jgi:hypothetical protein